MKQLNHLDRKTADALEHLLDELKESLKENNISVYLYGSAALKSYIPEKSNLNTLIILKKIDMTALRSIAGIYKKRANVRFAAPLVLTPDYISSSTDTFPIEFLDIKERALLLSGEDILKGISIDLSHLREECEREIKGQLVRFRGIFLEAEGDLKGLERLVVTAISNLVFPMKNVLRLLKHDIPEENEAVIQSCCKAMNVKEAPFLDAWNIKIGVKKPSIEGLYNIISGYMDALNDISVKIDAMKSEGRI